MNIAGIYMIQSKIKPERIYIGSATSIKDRWTNHRGSLRLGNHPNPILQKHCDKYGIGDLIFEVLESGEYVNRIHLYAREQMWFGRYAFKGRNIPFFNIEDVTGRATGFAQDKKSRAKRIEKAIGRVVSDETREKIRIANTGRKRSEESIKKQFKARGVKAIYQFDRNGGFIKEWECSSIAAKELGLDRTAPSKSASKKSMGAGGFLWRYKDEIGEQRDLRKDEIKNPEFMNNRKPIYQYAKTGDFLTLYKSVKEAHRVTGIAENGIIGCCKGISMTAGGYLWRYKNEMDCERNLTLDEIGDLRGKCKKRINQYSLQGEFIKTWDSLTEAGLSLKISACQITICSKRVCFSAGGFIWRRYDEFKELDLTTDEIGNVLNKKVYKPVIQLTIDGVFVNEYGTITEASKNSLICSSGISSCCKGFLKTAGGFVWKYKNVA